MHSLPPGSRQPSRRAFLGAVALTPFAALGLPRPAGATDYAFAADVFAAVDRLEAEVSARLAAVADLVPGARAFAASVARDHQRHRRDRERLRRRLELGRSASPLGGVGGPPALDVLRASQEALVYAHAEGLPAFQDAFAVDVMARHLVDLSRHLTVIDLWIAAEANRG